METAAALHYGVELRLAWIADVVGALLWRFGRCVHARMHYYLDHWHLYK